LGRKVRIVCSQGLFNVDKKLMIQPEVELPTEGSSYFYASKIDRTTGEESIMNFKQESWISLSKVDAAIIVRQIESVPLSEIELTSSDLALS
jgi:uncharacterized Fe-S cluster protein YjdI